MTTHSRPQLATLTAHQAGKALTERLKADLFSVSASVASAACGYGGFNVDGSALKWAGLAAMFLFAMAATFNIDRTKSLTRLINHSRAQAMT